MAMKQLHRGNLLHGCDYNPDQWLDRPDILKEDIRLMKKAGVNVVTLGIFSWSAYEPEEGVFDFSWMDQIMDSMYANKISVILATPSGGKPPWMAKKYPEVMRTLSDRRRLLYGDRENQCNSSEIFRDKVRIIDEKLAKRYSNHPALIMWHLSNEAYGQCHCQKCQDNFRRWLKRKYKTIDCINEQYWSSFWSHKYNDWSEIESPSTIGEKAMHALALDYHRFYSDLSIDFLNMEAEAVKKYNPDIPVTTNMFHHDCGINYAKLSKILDVISWDSYPRWHCGKNKQSEWDNALLAAFDFDYSRSLKGQPFYLMESVPSVPSQFEVCKLKRPGMHILSAIEAIACGSESVQYFQWRKGRGECEKFHGAVISHNGSAHTRVFSDVVEVGEKVKELSYLQGTSIHSDVAVIFDWENLRALYEQKSLKNKKKEYREIVMEYYEALLKNYVSVDIIDQSADFSSYKLIVAPMLYLFQPNTHEKIRQYVSEGGSIVFSFYSGLVNENDLAFECFPPYALNDVFGIRAEEIDCLCEDEYNTVVYCEKEYRAIDFCELIHADQADILAKYEQDFYKGMPAVTKNKYGRGSAYYITFRSNEDFLYDFLGNIIKESGIEKIVGIPYVPDVMAKERQCNIEERNCLIPKKYIFLMNFSTENRNVTIKNKTYRLAGYASMLLEQ